MDEKAKNSPPAVGATYELAGILPRFAALIVDGIALALLLAFIMPIVYSIIGDMELYLDQYLYIAVPLLYHVWFWTRRDGQTPGKSLLGIRVIKADGGPIGTTDAVIRLFSYQISAMVLWAGFLWAIVDRKNQSWHDKLARTYVVKSAKQSRVVHI